MKNLALLNESLHGDVRVVKALIESGNVNINARNDYGETPLLMAAAGKKKGHLKIVEFLLTHGASVDMKDYEFGETALIKAIKNNGKYGEEMVMLLLRHGANVNTRDREGNTPLWHASIRQKPNVVSLLIDAGADITNTDEWGSFQGESRQLIEEAYKLYLLRRALSKGGTIRQQRLQQMTRLPKQLMKQYF